MKQIITDYWTNTYDSNHIAYIENDIILSGARIYKGSLLPSIERHSYRQLTEDYYAKNIHDIANIVLGYIPSNLEEYIFPVEYRVKIKILDEPEDYVVISLGSNLYKLFSEFNNPKYEIECYFNNTVINCIPKNYFDMTKVDRIIIKQRKQNCCIIS